ncbi:type I polyketide synthase [Actinophytocola gossypii]|uniref:Acyltransferase domain-containing protein n=1 Tax=Actinophytocola gossypii TaxID=2812003 RepID=A0ABT2J261_9PSEU|nr:type I polyketide synthase [Actinophytocola gossypii]MCT2581930.1 acyltransferase domain-containing protein [Actinophytocola gossypii]
MNHEGTDTGADGVEPIAIVGMAARVPGANDLDQFWHNLVDGVESITFYSKEEQLALGVTEDEMDDPSWVSAAPVVDRMEYFDAGLFGMTAREAELTNPQHRLFLEVAHTALEHAGYDPTTHTGSVGVYAGTGADHYQWTNLARNAALWDAAAGNLGISSSNSPDYVATLVSYKLNLRGPSLTVHTACSTSLVAVHLAVESLRNAECDVALGGGVCVELPHGRGYQGLEGYTSPDGHCRPFDARADGTLWGSGAGVVVLKRLSDAVADGDTVHGLILGNAINNDGSDKVAFSAPSVEGQIECVAQALAVAGVDPRTVGYVEAHGTGTALGDPIEVTALSAAYGHGVTDRQWCGLGSVKSNLGHLSQAAGVVGLIKAVLALEHRLIPPTINFDTPNPAIDLANSPFHIATALSKWQTDGTPRRAGVSSFGIGGTNAHLVLQEAPEPRVRPADTHPAHLLAVSAHDTDALTAACERLAGHLEGNPDADLADVAHTLRVGRTAHPHRAMVVARDPEAAADALRDRRLRSGRIGDVPPEVALLFSGQGSQYAGMGAELYRTEPVFRAAVDECAELLGPDLDPRPLMFAPDEEWEVADERLRQTEVAQPALFTLEYALAALWRDRGVEPAAMIGHSVGEYVAATIAGVFTLPDALRLVATRGRLMGSMPPGEMLAVQLDETAVEPLLAGTGVTVATVNAPGTCVVAGPAEGIAEVADALSARGISGRRLRTSHAFHSAMMDPVLDEFAAAVAAVPRRAPGIRFLSNVTGDWITDEQATDPAYWAEHLRRPVRFGDCVTTLLANGTWALVECGPGRQLAGLARKQLPKDGLVVHSLPGGSERAGDVATLYAGAGQLWVGGVELDLPGPPGRRVPLPTYPYQRVRYWVEPDPFGTSVVATPAPRRGPLPLDEWFAVPAWRQLAPLPGPAVATGEWLVVADGPRGTELADALRTLGGAVTEVPAARLADRESGEALVAEGVPARIVHAAALDADPAADLDAAWRAQDTGFFALLALAQALAGRDTPAPVRLDVLSAGTEDVLGGDLTHPEQATLDGIARVLPLELPWLTVRRVDAPAGHATAAQVAAELCAGDDTVALRGGRRWSVEYQPVTLDADRDGGIRDGGRYLVTGGLGGVGISLAEDLAARHRARLVLLSRSGLPDRSEWDRHLAAHGPTSRSGRAITAIRRMEAAGATVLVEAADVTNPDALRAVRDRVVGELGGLDGIVHAAGVPGGGMAEIKERSVAAGVLAPKLAGTLALRQAFGDLPLDFVALCSSVTGVAGGFGQVDYCAANAFLDAHARAGHGWNGRVVSLDWGGWLEVGMAVETGGPAEPDLVALGTLDHPVLRHRGARSCWGTIDPETLWLLDEHRIAGVGVVPGTGHLDCARVALAACLPAPDGDAVIELSDVAFLEPLSVPDGAVAEYRVEVSDAQFTVTSRRDGVRREHVRGTGRWVPAAAPARVDLDAIRGRLTPVGGDNAFRSGGRTSMLTFGPRWAALGETRVGPDEELAEVRAPEAALADLDRWVLHPALLDVATSFGSRGEGSYLPLSYGRVTVHGRLPARFVSHLRYTGDAGETGVLTADLSLCDEHGTELVSVADFVLRRVDTGAVSAGVTAAPETTEAAPADERGIRPADGAEAFRRVLAADLGPQVVVNTETVDDLMARIRSTTTESIADEAPAEPVESAPAATELEATIAGVWSRMLGVERVEVDDDFFDLGGNSLVAVQLIAQLRKAVGVRLPMRSLFEQPTVAGLAARVEQLRAKESDDQGSTIPKLARRAKS